MIQRGISKKETLDVFTKEGVSQSVVRFISTHEPEDFGVSLVMKLQLIMTIVLVISSLSVLGVIFYNKWYWGYHFGWDEYFLGFKIIFTLLTTLFLSFLYRGATAYFMMLDLFWLVQEISLGDQEPKKLVLIGLFVAIALIYTLLVKSKKFIRGHRGSVVY